VAGLLDERCPVHHAESYDVLPHDHHAEKSQQGVGPALTELPARRLA
jgi:hypothetical protein